LFQAVPHCQFQENAAKLKFAFFGLQVVDSRHAVKRENGCQGSWLTSALFVD
jgi:hypothetical protein